MRNSDINSTLYSKARLNGGGESNRVINNKIIKKNKVNKALNTIYY